MMHCLVSPWHDPALNLAAEEFFLRHRRDDLLFLYVNAPSVIIGKHQNVFGEVSLLRTVREGVPVVRRLSGGGTVYHDEGNLNFSFILNGEEGKLVDFARHTALLVAFLRHHGVAAQTDRRHNIVVEGRKVSGHAEHVSRGRVLHHGTLLFGADLERLHRLLQPPAGVQDRAIASVRSSVTNLRRYLGEGWTMERFVKACTAYLRETLAPCPLYTMTPGEERQIRRLADQRYRSWEWNIAYSPPCRILRTCHHAGQTVQVSLQIEKGLIAGIELKGKEEMLPVLESVACALRGARCRPDELRQRLVTLYDNEKLSLFSPDEWLKIVMDDCNG